MAAAFHFIARDKNLFSLLDLSQSVGMVAVKMGKDNVVEW